MTAVSRGKALEAFALWLVMGTALAGQSPTTRGLTRATPPEGRRVALVIGIDRYTRAPLANAANDARALDRALRAADFDVTAVLDAGRTDLAAAIGRFAATLKPQDIAFFFFAGHGLEIGGQNFLIPADFDFAGATATSVRLGAVPVHEIQEALGTARISVIVLDACRNNPFGTARGGSGGLAPVEARGTLVAYATAAGRTASDNTGGGNGLFTQELVRVMEEPNLPLREIFFRVRQRVFDASRGEQFPALYDGLLGDVVLRAPPPSTPSAAPNPPAAAAPAPAAGTPTGPVLTPGYVVPVSVTLRPSRSIGWADHHFIAGAQDVYVPYSLRLDASLLQQPGIAVFIRAVNEASPGATSAWDDVHFDDAARIRAAGGVLQKAMALRPGRYRVLIAAQPLSTARRRVGGQRTDVEQTAVTQLVAMVDSFPRTPPTTQQPVLEQALEVPELRGPGLTVSSIIGASSVETVSATRSPEEQAVDPYVFGAMRIVPRTPAVFKRDAELSLVCWIYNAPNGAGGKPDITVEYHFYRVLEDGSTRYFNRTEPQRLNASTLPADFSAAAGHQLPGSLAVPLASFSPGEHELRIIVRDNVRSQQIGNVYRFTVSQ